MKKKRFYNHFRENGSFRLGVVLSGISLSEGAHRWKTFTCLFLRQPIDKRTGGRVMIKLLL